MTRSWETVTRNSEKTPPHRYFVWDRVCVWPIVQWVKSTCSESDMTSEICILLVFHELDLILLPHRISAKLLCLFCATQLELIRLPSFTFSSLILPSFFIYFSTPYIHRLLTAPLVPSPGRSFPHSRRFLFFTLSIVSCIQAFCLPQLWFQRGFLTARGIFI